MVVVAVVAAVCACVYAYFGSAVAPQLLTPPRPICRKSRCHDVTSSSSIVLACALYWLLPWLRLSGVKCRAVAWRWGVVEDPDAKTPTPSPSVMVAHRTPTRLPVSCGRTYPKYMSLTAFVCRPSRCPAKMNHKGNGV